jgi:hypothetical protein
MPDPKRLLKTLHCAIDAFRATPRRRGRIVYLEDAEEVLATGDLHGNVENFRRLLLKADLGKHPRRHLVLQEVIHSPFTYPGGGDKSHQLLDLVAALKCQFPSQVHFLLGNHELSQWTDQGIGKGDLVYNDLFRQGVETAYGAHAHDVYIAYLGLFGVANLAVRTSNRVFLSHSLPSEARRERFDLRLLEHDVQDEDELAVGGAVHALLWGRDTSATNVAAFLQLVDADLLITGHIPCEKGFEVPNDRQLILDCLGAPACYCLFPGDRLLTHEELVACVGTL